MPLTSGDTAADTMSDAPTSSNNTKTPTTKIPKKKLNIRIKKPKTPLQWLLWIIVVVLAVVILLWIWHETHKPAPVRQPASAVSAEYKKQLPALKKSVNQNPKDATARKNYAVALYATGDPGAAASQYEAAVKINSKDATAYNNLGNCYRDLHQTSKAVSAYQTAIKLNPQSVNTYANLANVQLYTQNKPGDAISTYQDGLKALPNNSQLQILLGLAYEANGQTDKAKQTYEAVLAHDTTNPAAQANLDRLNGKK